jgi:hypothetical protein
MAIAPEDLPQAPGANASLDFGQVGQNAADAKELEAAGGSHPQPPVGAPGPAAAPPQQPPQPVQAAPDRVPLNQNDMRPGGPVFMQPQLAAAAPWRQELRVWANHPEARMLRQLSQRADAGLPAGTKPPAAQGQQ